MIRSTFGPKTPGNAGVSAWKIQGFLAFRAVAAAAFAHRFATAIVVRNQVVLVVGRIVAGTNPMNGRGLAPRRAACLTATATAAK